MKTRYYTGIGSRRTPADVLDAMTRLAELLATHGYVLRSGGAEGADTAFALGATQADIYLPWRGFAQVDPRHRAIEGPSSEAMEMARARIPRFSTFRQGVQKLLARNMHQVLGDDLATPSTLLICWTKGGKTRGGTGYALAVAHDPQISIPVVNLAIDNSDKVLRLLNRENE